MAQISVGGGMSALKAAAEVFAAAIRVSGAPGKVKGLIHTRAGASKAFVYCGYPGGRWGWIPINAWMMETPGARHPLFGDRRRWYTQPQNHFMERGADAGMAQASKVYGDMRIDEIIAAYGYK